MCIRDSLSIATDPKNPKPDVFDTKPNEIAPKPNVFEVKLNFKVQCFYPCNKAYRGGG